MASREPMTLGELSEGLEKLDAMLFKAETGQAEISWDEYSKLRNSTEELRKEFARQVSTASGKSYEEFYKLSIQRRDIHRLKALYSLHSQLHPDFTLSPEQHDLLKKSFDGESTDAEGEQALADYIRQVFGYLLDKGPRPPQEARTNRGGFFKKLFCR
jgi:hypothetical protein